MPTRVYAGVAEREREPAERESEIAWLSREEQEPEQGTAFAGRGGDGGVGTAF